MNKLEREVIELFLAGDDPVFQGLREQMNSLAVTTRDSTGVGFYTEFALPSMVNRVEARRLRLTSVRGSTDSLQNGLGFVLYVDEGAISMLEGYTYDEPWPTDLSNLRLFRIYEGAGGPQSAEKKC